MTFLRVKIYCSSYNDATFRLFALKFVENDNKVTTKSEMLYA